VTAYHMRIGDEMKRKSTKSLQAGKSPKTDREEGQEGNMSAHINGGGRAVNRVGGENRSKKVVAGRRSVRRKAEKLVVPPTSLKKKNPPV